MFQEMDHYTIIGPIFKEEIIGIITQVMMAMVIILVILATSLVLIQIMIIIL